jgi:hypothetical protein
VPRRLRVAFPAGAQAPLVLEAQPGLVSVSGPVQTLSYVPVAPAGEKGQWTQLATLTPIDSTSWYYHIHDTSRDRIVFTTWRCYLYGVDRGTGAFTNLGRPLPDSQFHNRTGAYDAYNDRYWIGNGTADGGTSPDRTRQWWFHPTTFAATYAGELTVEPGYQSAHFYDPTGLGGFNSPAPRMVLWGGWDSQPGGKTFSTKALTTIGNWTPQTVTGTPPPNAATNQKFTLWRSFFDTRRQEFGTVGTNGSLYLISSRAGSSNFYGGWRNLETSGGPPPICTHYTYDASRDWIIGWCGRDAAQQSDPAGATGATFRETWTLDMGTLVWTKRANAGDGDTVPPNANYVERMLSYDPTRSRSFLTTGPGNANESTVTSWVYTAPARPAVGTITAIALQPETGSAYGVNNFGNLFARSSTQKHVNISYCPLNNRLYVFGGDRSTTGSATDGMWSMNCADGSWRCEAKRPSDNGVPSPSAYQDTCGFWWDSVRSRFVIFPRGQDGYSYNTLAYAKGIWTFDPMTPDPSASGSFGTFAQDLRISEFTTFSGGPQGSDFHVNGSGCDGGGIHDPTTNIVYTIRDSLTGGANQIWRYDLTAGTKLANLTWNPASLVPNAQSGGRQPNTMRTRWCRVGRKAYGLTTSGGGFSGELVFLCFNLDTLAMSRLSAPIIHGTNISTYIPMVENTMGVAAAGSNHVVWIHNGGPEGAITGIHVYNIAKDRWVLDTQIPLPVDRFSPVLVGSTRYTGGCYGEGPNNGIAFSGTVFATNGASSTHMFFYTPTGATA